MWIAEWGGDYRLLDTADGMRLERWGKYTLARPDPQVIWSPQRTSRLWDSADATYTRSPSGGGSWSRNKLPNEWSVSWGNLNFAVKPTGFKHTGLFPEQAANWSVLMDIIAKRRENGKPFTVLNLFAYTGASTLCCARAGATVTHVDAARGMVNWARENASANSLEARWIVDGCEAFVAREIRRGNRYDGIIMDPPSYGRGPGGEVWKLEDNLYPFVEQTVKLLSDNAAFFFINSYTTGLAPSVLSYILSLLVKPRFGGYVSADEIGLPVQSSGLNLPCGATGRWIQS